MASRTHEVETLLALRAVGSLDAADETRLNDVLTRHPELDDDGFDRAAAALTLALVPDATEIPASLEQRLTRAAEEWTASTHNAPAGTTPFRARRESGSHRGAALAGWLAAAAALILAALAWLPLRARGHDALPGPPRLRVLWQGCARRLARRSGRADPGGSGLAASRSARSRIGRSGCRRHTCG